jgi:hypothetical protein
MVPMMVWLASLRFLPLLLSLSLYCIPAAIEFTKIYPKLAFLGLNSLDLVLEGFTWSCMNYEPVVLDWYMDNNPSIPYWYEYSYWRTYQSCITWGNTGFIPVPVL